MAYWDISVHGALANGINYIFVCFLSECRVKNVIKEQYMNLADFHKTAIALMCCADIMWKSMLDTIGLT